MKQTQTARPEPMIVAGVMSGTSADGVDVALVRISATADPARPKLKLLGHHSVPFSSRVRAAVLAAMDAPSISVADLARLHWRLGQIYGDAVLAAQEQVGVSAAIVGLHGQTVYHQPTPQKYLGSNVRCTWQLGEPSETAARTGTPVVSDFRPADVAAGGQGAPLVPLFDRVMFSHPTRNRVLQNIGGIANMTLLPAASDAMLAWDSGPGNMVIDAAMEMLFHRRFDRNGSMAKRGNALKPVVDEVLKGAYFSAPPPKSCGREEFGRSFVEQFVAACAHNGGSSHDAVASATALTSRSILAAYRSAAWPFLGQHAPLADGTDYIVSGGGAKNSVLMQQLRDGLEPLCVEVSTSDDFGVPSEAKEAMAFALLAWLRWCKLPANVPAATGAARPAILGKVTLP